MALWAIQRTLEAVGDLRVREWNGLIHIFTDFIGNCAKYTIHRLLELPVEWMSTLSADNSPTADLNKGHNWSTD